MSILRGRIVWFLCCVTLAAGLMSAAGGAAHAQSTGVLTLEGTVTDSDGAPVAGLSVEASGFPAPTVTNANGYYRLPYFSLSGVQISVGDTITIAVKDGVEIVAVKTHVITAADVDSERVTVNIQLSDVDATATTGTLQADGQATTTIIVNIVVDGQAVTGDTVTIDAELGTVSDPVDNDDGTYTATYTAPELVLTDDTTDTITVTSTNTGETTTTEVTLTPVPTLVSVTAEPALFTAGAGETGTITVSVSRGGNDVTDADISISRSRGDGGTDTGMVGDVANNDDGTYTASYTPSEMIGPVSLTATDGVSGAMGSATVNVNAGPPAMVVVNAAPTTVSSGGTGVVTVTVTDESGNPVGGQTPTGSGMVGDFTETSEPGTYTASYTAPTVEEDGSDTITVTVGDATGETTVDLTVEPPMTVAQLIVVGTVNKADGTGAVAGVNVEVSINGNPIGTTTTGDNGGYSVTHLPTDNNAGSTGDVVTVVVTDADGEKRGDAMKVLMNADLGGDPVVIDVNSDVVSTTSVLAVSGTVYHGGGSVPVGAGLTVNVMNAATGTTDSRTTDENGGYSATLVGGAGSPAGSTGDTINVTVMRDGAQVGEAMPPHTLTSDEVDNAQAMVDVTTTLVASTPQLIVTGTVFLLDSQISAGPGLTVTVMNADTGATETGTTDANGSYNVTLISTEGPAAETGDAITVTVSADGEDVGSGGNPPLTEEEIGAGIAMRNVDSGIPAESAQIIVTGTVYLEDGVSTAPPGLTVTVTNQSNPDMSWDTVTEAGGGYNVTMVSAEMAVAATHDTLVLEVTVMDGGDPVGEKEVRLTTEQVVAIHIPDVDIYTTHTADPSDQIIVLGNITNPDGTAAREGVELRVTLGTNPTRTIMTAAGGYYSTTYLDPSGAPVVSVHDTLTIVAIDRESGGAANVSMQVASHHVLAGSISFDIALIADVIDPVAVATSSQKFVQKTEAIDFVGSESSDLITENPIVDGVIESYLWDFGDGNTADTADAAHAYADSGKYVVTLTVTDIAGNEGMASLDIFVDTVRLGGLSLNTVHGRDVIDKIVKLAIGRTDVGQSIGADAFIEMMRSNPATQAAVMEALGAILPPGMVPAQLLDAELPLIFEDFENIDLENFGNALTARPGGEMGMGILDSKDGGFTRIVTGNKLDVYLATPRGDVGSVTFRLDGPDFDPFSEEGTRDAREAVAGMTFPHTFQLEEEQAALLLPSWPGLGTDSGIFSSVTLRYSSDALPPEYAVLLSRGRQVPVDPAAYASAPLSPMMINGEVVWSGEVGIETGKIYYYYYEVTLNTPVPLVLGEGDAMMLSSYAIPDPRNLQLEDRGIVDALFTMGVQDAVGALLNPYINAIVAGQDISTVDITEVLSGEALLNLLGSVFEAAIPLSMEIMTTMNPQMVSVFTVPMSTADQSVWYTTIDLSDLSDGEHTIDANAFDSNGVQIDNRPVYNKKFVIDRSAPAIDISVDNGQNSAMYTREDGVIIATGLITPDPNQMASLMLNASSMDGLEDLSDFMFQIIRHDGDPASQMGNTWVPLLDPSMVPVVGGLSAETFDVFIASAFNDMISINARAGMPPGMLRSQELIIRGMNNDPALIAGEYGLRAVGIDNVGNLSSFTMPVRVNVVPPDPDQAVITNIVIGDCNKDGDLEDPFESQAPGESTIFANTGNLTLSIDIPNRTPHPLTGIVVQYKTMHGTASWMDIATIDAVGDVEWTIDDFASLIDGGGDDSHIYVRAVATNALTITDPEPAAPTVKLDAGVCPVQPEHIAVNVVPAGTNEETGGYCGIITVYGYTAGRTIPDLASVRFDLTMPDGSTMTIGEATESELLTGLLSADLITVLGNLVSVITDDGMGTSAPEATYRKWSITFNTASLLDSLEAPYVVNATMIGADGVEYAPIAGGTDDFLLDNGDVEVGTAITAVADAYGELAMTEAGVFQLGGFTAEGYDTPVAILTVDPAAPDWRVDGVHLVVNIRNEDGSKGDAVDVGDVTVEEAVGVDMADMTKTSSDKIFTVTITNLSVLGVGGDYVLQVLAHDSKGDNEAEDPAYGVAANVDNFTPPPMFTIDGRGEGMSLADFMAAHPLGYRIAQSDENMFPFGMNAPGVLMGDITVQIDGGTLADDLAAIDGTRHDFSIVASTAATGEGDHPASVTVTKRNGSASFDLVNLAIDRIAPEITVQAPTEDDEVSPHPTIHATYHDGEGYGIAVASDDPLDVPANVEIRITRLNPPDESGVPVDQNQLDDADDAVVYSPDDALTGGAYRTDVSVTDKWGNRSTASGEFTVAGTAPSVAILSPAADSVSDDGMPLISAVVTGSGALEVVTMIDGEAVDAVIDGKNLSYTPDPALAEGTHTVTITATDADGKSADASVTFSVEFDHSPPVVTEVSPQGSVWGPDVTLSVTAIDDQSGVASIAIALDGGDAVDGATRVVEGLTLGQHMATATVTNGDGYSQEYSWTFTIALDEEPPTIGSTSPHGVTRSTTPTVTVGATDLTGIASIAIAVMNSNGDAVEGETAMAEDGTSASFMPAGELANGEYSATAVVMDNSGNSASTSWSFIVEANYDTTMPSIDVVSPQGIVRVEMPSVSVSASDVSDTAQEGLSGVASIEISVAASDGSAVDGSVAMGDGSAVFTPGGALANGEYTATAAVTDNSGNTNTASWTFTVEVIRDETAPSIGNTSPLGISRSAMPEISVAATDEMSGIGSIEISVMNSAGGAVDGSIAMGDGSAVFTPGAALANDTYTASTVVTDNSGNVSTASWSFTVQVDVDTTSPSIDVVSPTGIVRVDMPAVSVSASDVSDTGQAGLSGVASIEISVAASDGSAVDGSVESDGSGSAVFIPGAPLANGEYTASATVTDNSGNASSTSWTFTVEVIMDIAEPVIGVTSPSGIVRVDMPTIAASATDDMSGVASIEISVAASDGSAVDGSFEFDGGTMAVFTPGAGLANDTYTATAVVTDNAGNETRGSWSFTVEVVMDTLPPSISATSPHGIVRDDMPSISVSATDDMSGVGRIAISVSNPNGQIDGNTVFDGSGLGTFTPAAGLTNGTYTVTAVVTDNAGNAASASWSFSLEADRAAPSINTTSPQGTIRTNMPRVEASATDDLSGIANIAIRVYNSGQVRIGGRTIYEGGTRAAFVPERALRNDTYSVAVDATDKSGNTSNASWSFTVQVDAVPPVISGHSPLGIVRSETPRVSVSATDDESGIANIEIRVLNSAFQRIGGRTVYQGGTTASFVPERALRNDTYTVGVKATDKAGNTADASWSFVLEADHTPPVINSTSPEGIIRDDTPRISVSGTDDISGIRNIEIRVLNSAFQRIPGASRYEGGTVGFFNPANRLKNDTYTVGVRVTDKAGNTTDADWVFTVEVDTVPPTIGDSGPHGIIRTSTPRVTVSATDDMSGVASVRIRLVNNLTFAAVPGATTFQGGTFASFTPTGKLDNGVYSVAVDVTDKSGNVATSGWSFTVEVDTTPPNIDHTSPSGSVRPESHIISVSATDNLSGIASIVISVRDGNQSVVPGRTVFEGGTIGTFVPARSLDFGSHQVSVRVSDKAGNVANATYSFTVESADGLAVLNARNYPNPFVGATNIAFTLTRSSEISIEIFDLSMRPVWSLSPRTIEATKQHVIRWDGTTSGGEKLSRGVYIGQIIVHDSLNPQYAILKMAIK